MSRPIEDYAVIGDTETIALVARDGSMEWLCLPRFDSPACFAALVGTHEHGGWWLAPEGQVRAARRRYRGDTLVLETELETDAGAVRIVDCMPIRGRNPEVVRVVEGVRGRVPMNLELRIRFDYGSALPWLREIDGRLHAIAGADALVLATPIAVSIHGSDARARFAVDAGDRVPFTLTWHASYRELPPSPDPFRAVDDTTVAWQRWADRCTVRGPYREAVIRSLLTLKALTYGPSGGMVAAGTTSLPEDPGGVRNWDYRYSWLRDATFMMEAMLHAGYREEAAAWRDWLLRAVAGDAAALQIMYGVGGERRLTEHTLEWLPGYRGSRPVRVGNAAAGQLQLDVFGETIELLHQARRLGVQPAPATWAIERAILEWLERHWREPDEGLWEIRSDRQHFTHSKVMAWVAFDRGVKAVEGLGLDGPAESWRRVRDEIRAEVLTRGFHERLGAFTQAFGSDVLDASALLLPVVGFLPPRDPRVLSTIAAIERHLVRDGFVFRYPTRARHNVDGVAGHEGAFIACSFWLADALVLSGRVDDARAVFEQVLRVRNDVGLLSEELDLRERRLIGNFPQAFSHVGLVNSAMNLTSSSGPARGRAST